MHGPSPSLSIVGAFLIELVESMVQRSVQVDNRRRIILRVGPLDRVKEKHCSRNGYKPNDKENGNLLHATPSYSTLRAAKDDTQDTSAAMMRVISDKLGSFCIDPGKTSRRPRLFRGNRLPP
jgi:hypothetical protein